MTGGPAAADVPFHDTVMWTILLSDAELVVRVQSAR